MRPLLHELAARDPNVAVRRLAIICLKNGSPRPDTIQLLRGIADSDDEEPRAAEDRPGSCAAALKKTADTR